MPRGIRLENRYCTGPDAAGERKHLVAIYI